MSVVRWSQLAIDEEITNLRRDGERIAIRDDEVRYLPGLDSAKLVGEAKHLSGIERDGFQGLVIRESIGNSVGGLVGQAAREGRVVKAGKGDFDAGGLELAGSGVGLIVGCVFVFGQRLRGPRITGTCLEASRSLTL